MSCTWTPILQHGLDEFDNERSPAHFQFIAEGNSTVLKQSDENVLMDRRKLLHIFNHFLVIGQQSSFSFREFCLACKQNDSLAELFNLRRNNEGSVATDEMRTCFNNMV